MKIWFISLGCLLLAEAFAGMSGTPNLTIEVRGIERPEGSLFVAVYASEETFLKKPLTGFRVEAKDSTVRIPCQGLPAGSYAISVFHDANGNGRLDTGTYGIPLEKYGFSNDAEGVMGPPAYKDCRFELKADTTLVLTLK